MLHIGGNNGTFPNVGIKTSAPNKDFSVVGEVSASNHIYSGLYSSINWNAAYTSMTASSGNWDLGYNGYTALTATSGNWDLGYSAYTSMTASSGFWNSVYASVTAVSGNWNAAYSVLTATSANWNDGYSAYTSMTASSGFWNRGYNGYTALTATSANWNLGYNGYTALTATSANWNRGYSAYTSMTASSGFWNSVYATTTALSNNWTTAYSVLTATSANWNASYSVLTGARYSFIPAIVTFTNDTIGKTVLSAVLSQGTYQIEQFIRFSTNPSNSKVVTECTDLNATIAGYCGGYNDGGSPVRESGVGTKAAGGGWSDTINTANHERNGVLKITTATATFTISAAQSVASGTTTAVDADSYLLVRSIPS